MRERGDGKLYLVQTFLMDVNHEVELSGSDASFSFAILWIMLSGSKVIMPNSESCLMWTKAVPPRVPAMNRMKDSGVFWCSFIKF